MNINKLFTWFDIETVILRKKFAGLWPKGMVGVSVYPDGVEVRLGRMEDKDEAVLGFQEWFGKKYDPKTGSIFLESLPQEPRTFPVTFEQENAESPAIPKLRPSFANFSLLPPAEEGRLPDLGQVDAPRAFPENFPPLFAFYSFKGGVGRTIHLISLVKALSEQDPPKQVLIVDADLEAPGLTWWGRDQLGAFEISFLDFLALAHYDDSIDHRVSLSVAEDRIRRQPLIFKLDKTKRDQFFLPAFREVDQLLRMPLRPEHVTREMGQEWIVSEILAALGLRLGVDAVIVDLRAGLSELASPLLFDPRVTRVLVTSTSGQSVEGTKLVLNESKKMLYAAEAKLLDYSTFATPTVIISMIQEEMRDAPAIESIREEITSLLVSDMEVSEDLLGKEIPRESLFDQRLIHLENLEKTLDKLTGTDVDTLMTTLADEWLPPEGMVDQGVHEDEETHARHLQILKRTGEEYEYAESGKGTQFLRIQSLKSLAQRFQATVPVAVIMGSKGSGKTFMYLQMARLKAWNSFLNEFGLKGAGEGYIWPLIQSVNLDKRAEEIVASCHDDTRAQLPAMTFNPISQEDIRNRILAKLEEETSELAWKRFWLNMMADSLSCGEADDPLSAMQKALSKRNAHVMFQIDGLEDTFQNVGTDQVEQTAIRALCQGVTNALREFSDNRIGLLIFIRKDLVKSSIKQNFGQFEALYRTFELKWNAEEALRLVAWLVGEAAGLKEYIDFDTVREAPRGELEKALSKVWGLKLGKPTSREAYTANWVIGALSDFWGQLQARDVVRLIRFASENALQQRQEYPGRLLPPSAIKNALNPCSANKVMEIQDEVSSLKAIFEKLKNLPEEMRHIPFDNEALRLTGEEVEELERLGIAVRKGDKYYMPEIFRRGLGFAYSGGARPKVVSLLKKTLRT